MLVSLLMHDMLHRLLDDVHTDCCDDGVIEVIVS